MARGAGAKEPYLQADMGQVRRGADESRFHRAGATGELFFFFFFFFFFFLFAEKRIRGGKGRLMLPKTRMKNNIC